VHVLTYDSTCEQALEDHPIAHDPLPKDMLCRVF